MSLPQFGHVIDVSDLECIRRQRNRYAMATTAMSRKEKPMSSAGVRS
jgi:hypothetical protein